MAWRPRPFNGAMAATMTSIRALAPARRAGRVPLAPSPARVVVVFLEAPNRQTNPPSSSSSDGIRGCDAVAGRRVVSLAALAAALGSPRLALANVVGDDAGEPTGLDPAGARPRLRKCPRRSTASRHPPRGRARAVRPPRGPRR